MSTPVINKDSRSYWEESDHFYLTGNDQCRGWGVMNENPIAGDAAPTAHRLLTYVLVPELRFLGHELIHQGLALGIVDDDHLYATRTNVFFRSAERAILTDDDFRDAV